MSRIAVFGIVAGGLGVLLACAWSPLKPSSHVSQHWGESVQVNMAAMVANPEAPSPVGPEGLDPVTAERVTERYYQGQKQQPIREIPTFTIAQ